MRTDANKEQGEHTLGFAIARHFGGQGVTGTAKLQTVRGQTTKILRVATLVFAALKAQTPAAI